MCFDAALCGLSKDYSSVCSLSYVLVTGVAAAASGILCGSIAVDAHVCAAAVLLLLQITTVDEASQFYPLFGLGANVALIFSGRAVKIFSQIRAELPPDVDGWGLSLRGLMGMVVIGGFLIAGIFYWLNRTVVPRVQKRESKKKKKAKMSVGESFTFLAGSRCGARWGARGVETAGACWCMLCGVLQNHLCRCSAGSNASCWEACLAHGGLVALQINHDSAFVVGA
jgi:hypothetical protein